MNYCYVAYAVGGNEHTVLGVYETVGAAKGRCTVAGTSVWGAASEAFRKTKWEPSPSGAIHKRGKYRVLAVTYVFPEA